MKIALALVSLTVALVLQPTSGAPFAPADLKQALLRWKASPAGQEAIQNGFVPPRSTGMFTASGNEPTLEELARFQNSMDSIERLQKEQPHAVFSIDTPFALMTPDEFTAYVGMGDVEGHLQEMQKLAIPLDQIGGNSNSSTTWAQEPANFTTAAPVGARNLRAETTWSVDVDWQTRGCVTRVKNQGQCGVCWAFAATAALESGYCVSKGHLYELSEQEIVSCSRSTPMCTGYNSAGAFDWVLRMNGGSVCTEESYPYVSGSGEAPACGPTTDPNFKCNKPDLGAYFYGGGFFEDHTLLEAAVLKQPVSMAINAGSESFAYYKGGVLMGNEQACPAGAINHEVLIVGFGTRDGIPYWKVKNQWSEEWGDHGYMYIERGYQGHKFGACGIELNGYYPIFRDASDAGLNKRLTQARWYSGIVGSTLKTFTGVWIAEQCADRCRQEPHCKGYNYKNSSSCELKSSYERLEPAPVYSGLVISKAESLKQCAPILDNVDYPGNDVMTSRAATASDCCDHCNQQTNCNAFTWTQFNGGSCYMKTMAPAEPVQGPPQPDGSAYFKSGISYKCQSLQTNTDRTGSTDLGSQLSSTAANCCGICRSTANCYAFSWNDYNGGTCWLKGINSQAIAAIGVTSARVH